MVKGVALKIRSIGGNTAADIINFHYKVCCENEFTYFSTNIMCDEKRTINQVLFFFEHHSKRRYVLAEMKRLESKQVPFIPTDSMKFSPKQYADEPKKSWFLISEMREVEQNVIDSYSVRYTDGTSKRLEDVISSPRLNRVYYVIDDLLEKQENILIQ